MKLYKSCAKIFRAVLIKLKRYFGRAVPIIVRFRSTLKRGVEEVYIPLTFDLNMLGDLSYSGPDGQTMHVGSSKYVNSTLCLS